MSRLLPSVAVAIVLLLPACRESKPEAEVDSAEQERAELLATGKAAMKELGSNLGGRLKKAIAEGGPVSAVKVCQVEAQPMTEAVGSQREGVTISRTSLKYRNPKNAPDPLDRSVLEEWQGLLAEGKDLPDLKLHTPESGPARVYKPIMLQPVCLNCHGADEQLLPELKTVLDDLYPEDRARGFKVGDLRGAFRVDIERSPDQ